MRRFPPSGYFVGSAVFHYLGPAFAVLLFARVEPLGVAWLRIVSAAVILGAWRRPWRARSKVDPATRRLIALMGGLLAVMNASFYTAIDHLPLGTVAAIVPAGDRARRARDADIPERRRARPRRIRRLRGHRRPPGRNALRGR